MITEKTEPSLKECSGYAILSIIIGVMAGLTGQLIVHKGFWMSLLVFEAIAITTTSLLIVSIWNKKGWK